MVPKNKILPDLLVHFYISQFRGAEYELDKDISRFYI